ncbi:hypothetical protein RUND412_002378 [Rhizina undulata]
MRSPSLLCPTTSLSRNLWTVLTAAAGLANAINFTSISQPTLNLDTLGMVGLAGDFDGISLYEYVGQNENSRFSNGSQSLMTQLPNGLFTTLVTADASIQAMCVMESSGMLVVGGNFTSLGNVQANGMALFNPTDGTVEAIDGLDGKVNALLCDADRVYVGGEFSASNSTNAITWNGSDFVDLPFQGFDKAVDTITMSANNTIIFGGIFTSVTNSTTATNVRFSQTVNLVSTNITAEETTSLAGFNDPTSITCLNGSQWLVQDGQQGAWTADFGFQFTPTKLRLVNANYEGRGTKIFRLRAFPIGGIMNLTYIDPSTNTRSYCDANCPLANSTGDQDFEFVNDVGMNSIRLDLLEFYGAGSGLGGIQLFQDDIYSFAVTDFNEPSCAVTNTTLSNSTITGSWTQMSGTETDSDYLSINLTSSELSTAAVVFEPSIPQAGEYRVLLYTPGCLQDDSCGMRGEINVTATYSNGSAPSVQLFQTNNYDKYDVIWNGQVDVAAGGFRPSITLAPAATQSFDPVNIVAQKVQFVLISANNGTTVDGSSSTNSTKTGSMSLNGLFEYDTSDTEITLSDIENSVISSTGLELSTGAQVVSLAVQNSLTYVAGNFSASDNTFQNFFAINNQGPLALAEEGLNGAVYTMAVVDGTIYLGGQFTATKTGSTSGCDFVAAYDISGNSWSAMGGGVNGMVTNIVPMSLNLTSGTETVLSVTGDFDTINTDSNYSSEVNVEGFAIWIPSLKQWLERVPTKSIAVSGALSASVNISGSEAFYAGSVSSHLLSAFGAVTVTSNTKLVMNALPLDNVDTSSSVQKRAVADTNFEGVSAGVFYESGSQNYTVVGGHFEVQGESSVVYNLAFINGASNDAVTGFDASSISSSSYVLALHVVDTLLFVGGSLEGNVSSNVVSGIVIWDMSTMDFAIQQPPGLEGSAASVAVHSITDRPDTSDVFVAGEFETAGSFSCSSLCIFDNSAKQWGTPGGDISGVIRRSYWIDTTTLIVAGNMTINGTADTYIALYNAQAAQFEPFAADTSAIPGPVTCFAVDSTTADSLFIAGAEANGTSYIMKFYNGAFVDLGHEFGETSTIRNIQVMKIDTNHAASNVLSDDLVLLVTGSLYMNNFGNASAAIYDGTTWTPFLLTSKSDGSAGSISSVFSQREQSFATNGSKLAKGFVILISLAIALGLVFLIVVLGVLASYISRRREGYIPAPTSMSGIEKSASMQDRLPPESLLSNLNQGRATPTM